MSAADWSGAAVAVRLVIFDCDRTLWDHHNVSELGLPFRRTDEDTVEDTRQIRVRLFPGARDVLEELRRRETLVSVVSWNHPESVFAIFNELGLTAYFIHPKVEFHPYKEKMIAALLDDLAAEGVRLRPEEVLFVDDSRVHLQRARRLVGQVRTLRSGGDITDLREVLRFLD